MQLGDRLTTISIDQTKQKSTLVMQVSDEISQAGYRIVEDDTTKPWGAYFRIDGKQADTFISEFFPGVTPAEARLGIDDAEISPKILLVSPKQRLSWQYHNRRAERWAFLTPGAYYKSSSDDQGQVIQAEAGEVVQFDRGERHRLVGADSGYTLVAEIWQHTDKNDPSNEDDIIRLADDYSRA